MEIITNKTIIEDMENKLNYYDENNGELTKLYILYNIKSHFNYKHINYDEKIKILELIYYIYIKDESGLDLANIAYAVMGYYQDALKNKITKYNIYEYIENNNIPCF